MARLRENTEAVALYHGEQDEAAHFRERFTGVISNWWGIVKRQKMLTWFQSGYDQAATNLPTSRRCGAARLFLRRDSARRTDADGAGIRPGPGRDEPVALGAVREPCREAAPRWAVR